MSKSGNDQKLTLIGRAERIRFIDAGPKRVPAKIDTGADVSSVWASHISKENDHLSFRLFGPSSDFYSGQTITLAKGDYKLTRIANSFGARELRYVVKLQIEIKGRLLNGSFSLANRSQKIYPVLLGRKLLKNKFIVDVAQGSPLLVEEKRKHAKMRVELSQHED